MTIDSYIFTGSTIIPDGFKIINTTCFYDGKCIILVEPDIYKPIVVNFLLYDIWYILFFVLFYLIAYKVYRDMALYF